jgi:hypothetical protein
MGNKKSPIKNDEAFIDTGGSGEIRTRDQRIKSPLLYRLSYRPNLAKKKIIADFLN